MQEHTASVFLSYSWTHCFLSTEFQDSLITSPYQALSYLIGSDKREHIQHTRTSECRQNSSLVLKHNSIHPYLPHIQVCNHKHSYGVSYLSSSHRGLNCSIYSCLRKRRAWNIFPEGINKEMALKTKWIDVVAQKQRQKEQGKSLGR